MTSRDGRASLPRRHRELVRAFKRDLGDGDLTEAEKALIELAAMVTVRAEVLKATLLGGGEIDDDGLVRLVNSATRILTALGAKQKSSPTDKRAAERYTAALERQQAMAAERAARPVVNDDEFDPVKIHAREQARKLAAEPERESE